jgi:uncharacterized membrane protein YidH (DUF202 family)
MKIAGILLILVGIAALFYGEISYTSKKKAMDIGSLQIDKTENHTFPLSPIFGIVVIAGGAGLIYLGAKRGH